MIRRVWISPTRFRISKPGFDAATAGDEGLLFSEQAGSLQPAFKGGWTCPAAIFKSNGERESYGTSSIVLPEPGVVPLFMLQTFTAYNRGGSLTFTVNADKTRIDIRSAQRANASGRYVIFKNRQF